MPTFEEIYAQHADKYDALVSREDYQGNILPALENIQPLTNIDVAEMGAGTGRLTRLLVPRVKSIHAYDASQHMLDTAAESLRAMGLNNWTVQQADNLSIPSTSDSADLSIAGWSIGHAIGWYPDRWREVIKGDVSEMLRVLRRDGSAIIIETLGTGNETPHPPTQGLADYYTYLEAEHGFTRTWIRTDYRFESLEEAESLTRFFFGDDLADRVVRENLVILPECTGLWYRKK